MTSIELLRAGAEMAFADLLHALDGVTEAQAWAVLPNLGPDYLHTDGSIHGITLHLATGKFLYGSICFRNLEIRWRDLADEVEKFEPSWESAVPYLKRGHAYWMESWADLTDEDLASERPHPYRGDPRPISWFLQMQITHDAYHAGQIAMLRYGCSETDVPPPSVAEDIRKYCPETVAW